MSNRTYQIGIRAHNIADFLGVPYGDAWQVAQCEHKRPFATKDAALEWGEVWGQGAYECPVCHRWHCTNNRLEEDDE